MSIHPSPPTIHQSVTGQPLCQVIRLVSCAVSQLVSQSVSQSVSCAVSQLLSWSVSQLVDLPVGQSVSQSVSQPFSHSRHQFSMCYDVSIQAVSAVCDRNSADKRWYTCLLVPDLTISSYIRWLLILACIVICDTF